MTLRRLPHRGIRMALAAAVCLAIPSVARADLLDFSVYGEQGVSLANKNVLSGLVGSGLGADVTAANSGVALGGIRSGGNFTSGTGLTVANGIWANGNVSIDGNATSDHNGGGILAGGPSIFLGGTHDNLAFSTANVNPPPVTPPTLPTASVFASNPANPQAAAGGDLTLAPGTYGAVTLGGGHLFLESGVYVFDSFAGGNSAEITIDLTNGGIQLFVVGNFQAGNGLVVDLINGTAADVYLEVHGNFAISNSSTFFGTVFTPFGNINVGNGGSVVGALYAGGTVDFGNGGTVNLLAANFLQEPTPTPIPEPTSLALWGMTVLCGAGCARRRHWRRPKVHNA